MNAILVDDENGWIDPDDAPELTDDFFDKAIYEVGGQPAPNPLRRPKAPGAAGKSK